MGNAGVKRKALDGCWFFALQGVSAIAAVPLCTQALSVGMGCAADFGPAMVQVDPSPQAYAHQGCGGRGQ